MEKIKHLYTILLYRAKIIQGFKIEYSSDRVSLIMVFQQLIRNTLQKIRNISIVLTFVNIYKNILQIVAWLSLSIFKVHCVI